MKRLERKETRRSAWFDLGLAFLVLAAVCVQKIELDLAAVEAAAGPVAAAR